MFIKSLAPFADIMDFKQSGLRETNSQSSEDVRARYTLNNTHFKNTFCKDTLWKYTLWELNFEKYILQNTL